MNSREKGGIKQHICAPRARRRMTNAADRRKRQCARVRRKEHAPVLQLYLLSERWFARVRRKERDSRRNRPISAGAGARGCAGRNTRPSSSYTYSPSGGSRGCVGRNAIPSGTVRFLPEPVRAPMRRHAERIFPPQTGCEHRFARMSGTPRAGGRQAAARFASAPACRTYFPSTVDLRASVRADARHAARGREANGSAVPSAPACRTYFPSTGGLRASVRADVPGYRAARARLGLPAAAKCGTMSAAARRRNWQWRARA